MGTALDLIIENRRQQAQSERQQAELISQGFESVLNFVHKQQRRPEDELIRLGQLADARLKLAQLGLGVPLDQAQSQPVQQVATEQANVTGRRPFSSSVDDSDVIVQERNILGIPTKTTTAQNISKQEKIKVRARKVAEANFNKELLRRDVSAAVALESTIPRSSEGGVSRLKQGGRNILSGFLQDDQVGENIASYRSMVDLLTPRVARAGGDVANIAVAERKFSRGFFVGLTETIGTAQKKRAFQADFLRALDSEQPSEIKKLLREQNIPYFDLETNEWVGFTINGKNVTEKDIQDTMVANNLTRDQVLEQLDQLEQQ